jgi:hypothetical protein
MQAGGGSDRGMQLGVGEHGLGLLQRRLVAAAAAAAAASNKYYPATTTGPAGTWRGGVLASAQTG